MNCCRPLRLAGLFTLGILTCGADAPRVHRLEPTVTTVHRGYFSAEVTPALRIASGDIVDIETLITNTPEGLERMGLPPAEVQQSLRDITAKVPRTLAGHILTGPIHVEGAKPGMVLEVRILSVEPAIPYGYFSCSAEYTLVTANCEAPKDRIVPLDLKRRVVRPMPGVEIPLRPFFGIIGVSPPPSAGRRSSLPPDNHGGNMDIKDLVPGAKVFLPVFVEGGNVSIGDGHAAQGDGEVGGTAVETSLRGRVQIILHRDRTLKWPRIETPTYHATFGADADLMTATRIAVDEMTTMLMERGYSRSDANMLTGLAADLKMSEVVDRNMGVYMTIPKSVFVAP
ncbi:acetamidase/formamidase family protein [Phenylobacterium sp.]|jgi:acetamidase/formamidase|uniref:acetamidase/formamidase family protein n=1 Tax=Phenylobacterium sp. TaxID=1871053 RepID=UPI00378472AA